MELLLGFGVSGYRSFGGEIQRIGPLGKVTLLAGANNSGKSNVLSFVTEQLGDLVSNLQRGHAHNVGNLDVPQGQAVRGLTFSMPVDCDPGSLTRLARELLQKNGGQGAPEYVGGILGSIFQAPIFPFAGGLRWLDIRCAGGEIANWIDPKVVEPLATLDRDGRPMMGIEPRAWHNVWSMLTRSTGGDLRAHWIPGTLGLVAKHLLRCPPVVRVPAFRQIEAGSPDGYELSGRGMYSMLAKLQNPPLSDQEDKGKFRDIVEFVRRVTQVSDATIEVPFDRNTLLVNLNGRLLPISSLGTGPHQVILLAAAATLHHDTLVCLEEPELHLHPLLQRELLRYLQCHTTNQYLISTHSAHFLDTEGAAVFHVRPVDGWTTVQPVKTPTERFEICRTLGYHASDLLQSNAVIWVEGPSDRIYLLDWLRRKAPELKEGYQFAVMFYGGRLLSGLTAAEKEVDEFIHLRRLNRNFAVIMDSDKASGRAKVNATKKRIVDELSTEDGVAWITAVRTIENYVPAEAWRAAVAAVHPSAKPKWDGKKFSDPFEGLPKSANKVRLAEELVQSGQLRIDVHDLPEKLERLVAMIRRANPPVAVSIQA